MQSKNASSVLIGSALFYGASALSRTRFHIQEMPTKTTTAVTHYHIQKQRRAEFIEQWREDRGHEDVRKLPPRPQFTDGPQGDDPYARRLRRLANEARKRRKGRIHTPYDEQDLLATPRGTRTKFLVDRAIGSEASGITQVMIQFAPGKTQSLHRHPGEAWLYVVEGYGHSFMGTAPDKGQHHRWKKGDLIIVDHFLWHQHFNDDPKNQARLVRVHMFDSILETMRALTDPLVLFEEAEDTLLSVQEVSQIEWPDDRRPES